MPNKNSKKDKLKRKYTHPEFLKEFFPNIDLDEVKQDDYTDYIQNHISQASTNDENINLTAKE